MERRLRCWRRRSLWMSQKTRRCVLAVKRCLLRWTEQGTGSPSYQWYSSTTSAGSGVPVAEATSDTFTPPVSAAGETWYYCVVTLEGGGCSSIQSSSGAVSVVGDPSISAQPLSLDSLCVGGSLSSPLSVSYSGGVGSPSYQWSDGSGVISDATSATFLPSDYALPGTYTYSVEVSLMEGCDNVFRFLDG